MTMRLIRCLQFPGRANPLYLCPKSVSNTKEVLPEGQATAWLKHLMHKKILILSPSLKHKSFTENAILVKDLESLIKPNAARESIAAETISCFTYVTHDNGDVTSYAECVGVVLSNAESSSMREVGDVRNTSSIDKILPESSLREFTITCVDTDDSNIMLTDTVKKTGCFEVVPIMPPDIHPAFVSNSTNSVSHSLDHVIEKLEPFEHWEEVIELKNICMPFLEKKTASSASPTNKYPVIVIEGLDATGKSTLSANLAQKTGGHLLKSPPDCVSHLREDFDKLPSPLRRLYYSLSNYVFAAMIEECSETGVVVCDRFWHSTAAYAMATDVKIGDRLQLPPKGHWVYEWPEDLLKPDLIYFLSVSEEERIRRLRTRNIRFTDEEKWLISSKHFKERMDECYARMTDPGAVRVDAARSREVLCDFVVNDLRQRKLL